MGSGNAVVPLATDVEVEVADLSAFDELLTDKEVYDDRRVADEGVVGRAFRTLLDSMFLDRSKKIVAAC